MNKENNQKVTLVIRLPKKLERVLENEIRMIYKKFSRYRIEGYKDGKYRNIPHITLVEMGYCFENKTQIINNLERISNKQAPFEVQIDKLIVFANKDECHLVLNVKKTKQLLKLHNAIYYAVNGFAEKKPPYSLNQFRPHLTIITSLPKGKVQQAKRIIKLGGICFMAKKIAIKTTQKGRKTKMYKTFSLNTKK